MAASKVDNKALTEWKIRTIEIASSLQNMNEEIYQLSQEAIDDLYPYMSVNPSYGGGPYDSPTSELHELLLKLHTDASNLSMLLQRSKYTWQVLEHHDGEVPHPNEIVAYEVQPSCGNGPTTEKIDFVISGGLYKITDANEGKKILLVKEDVVLRTRD